MQLFAAHMIKGKYRCEELQKFLPEIGGEGSLKHEEILHVKYLVKTQAMSRREGADSILKYLENEAFYKLAAAVAPDRTFYRSEVDPITEVDLIILLEDFDRTIGARLFELSML